MPAATNLFASTAAAHADGDFACARGLSSVVFSPVLSVVLSPPVSPPIDSPPSGVVSGAYPPSAVVSG